MDPLQIESITFSNFKALVNTTLPLGRFTLIVGPNGSGKSTALQGIECLRSGGANPADFKRFLAAASSDSPAAFPQVTANWIWRGKKMNTVLRWHVTQVSSRFNSTVADRLADEDTNAINAFISSMRVYSLNPSVIPAHVQLVPKAELTTSGQGLAAVVDRLRDIAPERFEALNVELGNWLPEFDRILFDTPDQGFRSVRLRTRQGGHPILATELSQGTLLALTMLTLAYLPNPPPLIGLEEPDRGIHPRLLRDVRDALYRLAYPESFGESRPPVQVIATTQSPYFLDQFTEHPEEIVIAEKKGLAAEFQPLTSHGHIDEILDGAPLGDIWYSGVLGGVPSKP